MSQGPVIVLLIARTLGYRRVIKGSCYGEGVVTPVKDVVGHVENLSPVPKGVGQGHEGFTWGRKGFCGGASPWRAEAAPTARSASIET